MDKIELVINGRVIPVALGELRHKTALNDLALCEMVEQRRALGKRDMEAYRAVARLIGYHYDSVRKIWARAGTKGGTA